MNSEATTDSGIRIVASGKFNNWDIFDDCEVEVAVILADTDLVRAWLGAKPPETRWDYSTESEWRHYTANIAERRAEVEAEIHTALGIFADYEQEAVIIKHVVGNVFAVAHVTAPPPEEDGEQ
ncbi:MAG: hypothetical protein LBK23_02895 [Oscillospiraceae bacterium]|jgi:hypothetical protein|nr:hypothetical protein [Oscillospiraceae bacterium]